MRVYLATFDGIHSLDKRGEQLGVGLGDKYRRIRAVLPERHERLGVAPGKHGREPLERFVQQQKPVADHQCPPECNHLLLTAAQHAC